VTDAGPRGTRQTTMNGDAERVESIEGDGTVSHPEEPRDLAALAAERDAFLDQLQRSRAEFANFRRRTEQERAQIREIANQALLAQFLPVLDDFQRALAAVPEDQRQTPLAQGLELIERKFWGVLERAGVTSIEAVGQPFDPALHEAVAGSGTVVTQEYQRGYRMHDKVLRPSMVVVGEAAAAAQA